MAEWFKDAARFWAWFLFDVGDWFGDKMQEGRNLPPRPYEPAIVQVIHHD